MEDIGALQWKLEPPLEGEEKDEVEITEMLREIESFAQRIEDLAVEVNNQTAFATNNDRVESVKIFSGGSNFVSSSSSSLSNLRAPEGA